MHWTEKSAAKAYMAKCVAVRGWNLIGYSEDKSDMRYDHWEPAYWSGLATKEKDGKVYILNVSAYKPKVGDRVVLDNPGKASWHVECNGVIIDSGTGVFQAGYDASHRNLEADAKLSRILDRIDAACNPQSAKPLVMVTGNAEFTVRPGTKPGYVEILFKVKPDESIRNSLKTAGFRWSGFNGVWYGRENTLPAAFVKVGPAPEVAEIYAEPCMETPPHLA